jgi:hypothetical protein
LENERKFSIGIVRALKHSKLKDAYIDYFNLHPDQDVNKTGCCSISVVYMNFPRKWKSCATNEAIVSTNPIEFNRAGELGEGNPSEMLIEQSPHPLFVT